MQQSEQRPKVNLDALTEEQFQALSEKITTEVTSRLGKCQTDTDVFLERFGLRLKVRWEVTAIDDGLDPQQETRATND